VNDELDPFSRHDTDFEKSRGMVRADKHGQIVDIEYSDGVAVSVEDVLIGDLVLALPRMTGSTTTS
jgi:hypothetical protein